MSYVISYLSRAGSFVLEYVAVRVVGIGYPHRPYPAVPFITIFNSFSFFTVYLHVDVHRLNELHSCALPCSNILNPGTEMDIGDHQESR